MTILIESKANLLNEELILLSRAGNTLPDRVHCSTPRRWASQGVRNVKLETIALGGRIYTSREALSRFFARLTASRPGCQDQSSPQRERQQAIAGERAQAIFGPGSGSPRTDPPRRLPAGQARSKRRTESRR
jgi:hypothetical protein